MKIRVGVFWGLLLLFSSSGCNPYDRRSGEYSAGPVDVSHFPAAYLGAGGDPKFGGGVFAASDAFVEGNKVGYYPFPFSKAQLAAADPLALGAAFATPPAYVFDPGATDPFPARPRCAAPAGYVYDVQRDGIHYDDQGNVFTALPADATYVPLVAEVPVQSKGEPCQSIKSSDTLVQSPLVVAPLSPPPKGSAADALPSGVPDGKIVAWALVDPSAQVLLPDGSVDPKTFVGPQKLGWYNHYLTQYIDGGYVPTMGMDLVAQTLYVPTLVPGTDMNGAPAAVPTMGTPGSGFDVLTAARGAAGYSPVCQVMTFVPADPMNPPTSVADIDMTTVMPAPTPFLYCFQVL
jgi:hypothetical protein